MTSLSFMGRKSFIDISSHMKPHFHATYIEDAISKHVLHGQFCREFICAAHLSRKFSYPFMSDHHWPMFILWRSSANWFHRLCGWSINTFSFDFQTHAHIHTFRDSPPFYSHTKGWDFGLISACYLPHSAIIEMAAWVALLLLWGS